MKISDVAEKTGLSTDTLRFYEKIGLIQPPPRDGAGHRDYGEEVLGWIRFLDQLNATGMRQADRVRYAKLREAGPQTYAERRQMMEVHREEVRVQLAKLGETLALLDRKIDHYHELEAKEAADV